MRLAYPCFSVQASIEISESTLIIIITKIVSICDSEVQLAFMAFYVCQLLDLIYLRAAFETHHRLIHPLNQIIQTEERGLMGFWGFGVLGFWPLDF